MTYIRSPYGYVNNTDAVDSGIIKVVITDKNGDKINLDDLDDPVDMTVDMSKVKVQISVYVTIFELYFG